MLVTQACTRSAPASLWLSACAHSLTPEHGLIVRRGDCADLFHTADGARAENRDAVAGGLVVTIDHVPHGTAATVPDDSGTRQRVSITQHRIAARVAAKFDPQVPREAESKRAIRGIP